MEAVTLIDRKEPESYGRILAALDRVGPWARPKLTFQPDRLKRDGALVGEPIPLSSSIIAVHACGHLTDHAIELAIRTQGAFAALPCCRSHRLSPAPRGLKRELGGDLATDVHRTYRLEAAGYQVRWKSIPETITPMNRVIVGMRR